MMKGFPAALLFCLLSAPAALRAQNVALTVSNILTAKGTIVVSIFRDDASFQQSKPAATYKFSKAAMRNGTMKVSLSLAEGTYGIAILDDENGNNKMDNNMIGLPKEGFGFSNFYLSGMSRPSFSDFKFEVRSAPVSLTAKIRKL